MEPLISIIVPVYNTKKYISRCITSIIEQTYSNLEIILVNDGSTDGSEEICNELANQFENVKVVHKTNGGLGYARNSGIKISNGKYISFIDSDDYIEKNMYSEMIKILLKSKADTVYCDFSFDKDTGEQIDGWSILEPGVHTGKEVLLNICGAHPQDSHDFRFDMSVCKGIFSKEIILKYGIAFHNEKEVISEDLMFDFDYLPLAKRVVYINQPFYHYCENWGSLTHRYIPYRLEREKELYNIINERLPSIVEKSVQDSWVARFFLGRIRSCITQEIKYNPEKNLSIVFENIKQIINDETVRYCINKYPINQNHLKLRLFNFFLNKKNVMGIYILIKLKNR